MFEDKKNLISVFIAGFSCGFAVCAILVLLFSHNGEGNVNTSSKVVSRDSTVKKETLRYTETVKKGKEDTTRTSKVISSHVPGKLNYVKPAPQGGNNTDTLKYKILLPDQVASWDTLDTKTGFFAYVRYNITRNYWNNLFNVPQLKIERTDTLKTVSEKETIQERHLFSSSETITLKTEKVIPMWQLKLGASYRLSSGSEAEKYLALSYTKKFMFFYLSLEGGLSNNLMQPLTGIHPLLKGELNLPLWN